MAFLHKRAITVDHNKTGTADSSNFPILVSGTYAYLATTANGGYVTNSSGYDVGFYSDAALTTKLNWETELYTASTGQVLYWVQVPTIKSTAGGNTTDTVIYMAYGDSTITTDQSATTGTTWDSNYKGVYHLQDNAANTTVRDSSQNAVNLACNANTSTISSSSGQVGSAFNINTSTANRSTTTSSTLISAGNVTLEAWVKPSSTSVYQCLIANATGDANLRNYAMFLSGAGTSKIYVSLAGSNLGDLTVSPTWTNSAWNHIMMTADGSNVKIYINGVLANTTASALTAGSTAGYTTGIGVESGTTPTYPVSNLLDECRISLGAARSSSWALASYNNQSAPDKAISGSTGFYAISGDLNQAFAHKRSISIDYTKTGSTDSTNFPVLVSGTYTYLKTTANGGFVTNSSGYDIGFYSDFGLTTKLNWETEKYTATTGEVVYWVQVPTVKSTASGNTTDTIIYMAYGNGSITTDQSNAVGTWDSNFKGVWHLPNGTSLTAPDSTSNANNGSLINTPTATTGQIDGASNLVASSSQYIDAGNSTTLNVTNSYTMSAWIYLADTSGTRVAFSKGTLGSGTNWHLIYNTGTSPRLYFGVYGITTAYFGTDPAASTWVYVTATGTANGGNTDLRTYYNGNLGNTYTNQGSLSSTSGTSLRIGIYADSTLPWNGKLDELRISNTPRSGSWILAEYNNQSAPDKAVSGASGFYTISGELSLGGTMGMMGVG